MFLGDPFSHFFFDADFEAAKQNRSVNRRRRDIFPRSQVMTDHLFPERDLWDEKWRDEDERERPHFRVPILLCLACFVMVP